MRQYASTEADRRLGAAVCVAAAVLAGLDLWWTHPAAFHADVEGGGLVGTVAGILSGLSGLFRGKIDSSAKFSINLLRVVISGLAEALTNYSVDASGKLGKVGGILIRLWDSVLLPFFKKADARILRIYNWLRETFGPIVSALLWLRKHVIDFYGKWFKPIFDTIDAVRGILRVLGVLHVDFARKLDEKLARLEARLLQPIRLALETINTLIDWTERIITVDGFFQRYTLIRSLLLHEHDALKVWWHTIHAREIETKTPPEPWPAETTSADVSARIVSYAQDRSGVDAAASNELAQDIVLSAQRSAASLF